MFLCRVLGSCVGTHDSSPAYFEEKNTSNSELSIILLLELRTLKRHVSTNKNIHLQKKNTHIQLLYSEEVGLLCETLRVSSSSRVSIVDSFTG